MECEVRVVGGIQSCFVSLPLFLIQTLQSTVRGAVLPPLLALELRSRSGDQRWNVAWSGSASRSTAIEVAQQLAECISLPDFMQVRIKVIQHLPKAEMVSVEPCTEDDWEILELNSDLAENNILTQVGILQEGMKFPIWLHNHTVVRFLVQSVSPKQAMVQLIPGTEVAVAPKTRGKCKNSYQDVQAKTSISRQHHRRALLRIQRENKRFVHKMQFRDVELGVVLTTAIFMHPVTARNLSFSNFQLVEILSQCCQDEAQSKDSTRHTIVHLLLSDSVARGHVMVPHSLRLFLRAGVHSWVSLKIIDRFSKQNVSKLTLSPCRFKLNARNETSSNGNDLNNLKKDLPTTIGMPSATNTSDWSLHGELLASLCHLSSKDGDDIGSEDETRQKEYPIHAWFTERFKEIAQYAGLSRHDKFLTSRSHVSPEEEAISEYQTRQKEYLIHAWLTGQLRTISQYAGEVTIDSVVLADETLFHFEVVDPKSTESGGISENSGATGKDPVEVMFLLSTNCEETSAVEFSNGFDLSFKLENGITGLNLELRTVEFGEPISLISVMDNKLDWKDSSTTSSLSWLEMASPDAIRRLTVLLSASSGKLFSAYQLPLPGHVLIYGPSGCGKTSLNRAIARYFEEHEAILAHIVFVSCSDLASEKTPTIRQTLKSCISEAMVHSPSLVIFDDLDKLVPISSELEGSQPSNSVIQLVGFLTGVMDEYAETRQNTCGLGPIAFLASSRTLGNLPQDLVSPGRFDFHIQLPAPGAIERSDILNHKIQERSLQCAADVVSDLASKCDGYDAHDLDALVNRAVHAATGRYRYSQAINENKTLTLIRDDFSQAMQDFTPFVMRSIKKVAQEERTGWEDVGGLADIRNTIQEMLEMPSKFSSIFSKAPLRLRSNVLLYGPPGCGKTHIVGAAAAACSLRFISVKGPELLNKYIGASEQAVRDLFTKAAAAAPCLLFFDEFDSIAPKRGHDNTGVTDRVVNQLLTELDGVETLTGVFVFAATSRPDLLDAALLRPGRLDRLLFCDFPSWHDRLEILKVLSRKLPLASDVNLETIASMTEGFTGADLQALLSDTQLALVNELIANNDSGQPAKEHIISDVLLRSVASQARTSISNSEKERLYAIYSQFLDAKKSVNSRARDAKGKRATLA